ncbi:hypothetical protein BD779DRAFT_1469917 [Infundibulicybe gibba]|nr:hypothetical protein BD779DRAFT_1469917 [Infundibulicybe gibba]
MYHHHDQMVNFPAPLQAAREIINGYKITLISHDNAPTPNRLTRALNTNVSTRTLFLGFIQIARAATSTVPSLTQIDPPCWPRVSNQTSVKSRLLRSQPHTAECNTPHVHVNATGPGLDALFLILQHTLISRYSAVSGVAFYAWDFCITIQDEVEYFWIIEPILPNSKCYIGCLLVAQIGSRGALSFLVAITAFFGLFIVQDKILSTVVGILCVMQAVAAVTLIGLDVHYIYGSTYASTAKYPQTQDIPAFLTGCDTPAPPYFYALGIPYIIFDFILFALATSRSLLDHLAIPAEVRSSKTLISIMLRDSIVVFVITFLLNLANSLNWQYGPYELYGVLVYWSPLIPGVFANHMLINLRKVARSGIESETSGAQMATMRFDRPTQTGDLDDVFISKTPSEHPPSVSKYTAGLFTPRVPGGGSTTRKLRINGMVI